MRKSQFYNLITKIINLIIETENVIAIVKYYRNAVAII